MARCVNDSGQIEFPSILLPPDISSGSIVDITVARNTASELAAERAFRALQDQIFQAFGAAEPATPVLRCRNATQTSVVLEWDPVQLATADLMSLSLFRNGQKAGNIPDPRGMHSTKISGLAVDTEYTFHLVLRTSAGTYASERVAVRTHKMTDLSGITITTGLLPATAREKLARAVERIGAKMVDGVRIDTTHFVTSEGRGVQWERANEMNIPVVRPEWVEACEKNGRILGVTKFYLDAVPPAAAPAQPQQRGQPPSKDQAAASEQGKGEDEAGAAAGRPDRHGRPERYDEGGDGGLDDAEEQQEKMWPQAHGEQEVVSAGEREREREQGQPRLGSRPPPTVLADDGVTGDNGGGADNGKRSPADGASFQDVAL